MPDFEDGAIYVMGLTTYLVPGRNVCEAIANRHTLSNADDKYSFELYRHLSETVRDLMLAGF